MNEQSRIRLAMITSRYGARVGGTPSEEEIAAEREAVFLNDFNRIRFEILRPIMEEIGAHLTQAGHGYRVETSEESRPAIALALVLRGAAPGSKNVIRFFASTNRRERRNEMIAEVELRRSPFELTRFRDLPGFSREVAEHLIVEAVEQIFASNAG